MMTTKNGINIKQNTHSIIKKEYNYPNEIWDIIKEYIGIGCYIYRVLENLNTTQLKNIIN